MCTSGGIAEDANGNKRNCAIANIKFEWKVILPRIY